MKEYKDFKELFEKLDIDIEQVIELLMSSKKFREDQEEFSRLRDRYIVEDKGIDELYRLIMEDLKLVEDGDLLGIECQYYRDNLGQIYMTVEQLQEMLAYSSSAEVMEIHKLYSKRLEPFCISIARYQYLDQARKNQDATEPSYLYNEDGIYEFMFISKQEVAETFRKKAIQHAIEIRKNGFSIGN